MLRLILLSTALAAGLTSWPTSDSTSEFASGPADKDWTILVYGASDNSSEESFVPDMHSLMQGLASPGIEVLGFVDRSPEFSNDAIGLGEDFADSRLYRLTSNGPRRVGGGEHFPEITVDSEYEANSGAVATLRKALRWAKATSPAKRYGVIFYSHGGGWSWCPDDTDGGDQLYPAELTVGLEAQDSLDLMVFDVCLMGGIENAYQWRPREDAFGVDVMLATPMAGYPFPWGSILENIAAGEIDTADLTAREFGRIIVQVTKAHRTRMQDRSGEFAQVTRNEAMACYDLSKAAAVKSAVDQLARELASIEGAEEKV
ncbi:MAG: clostripain, partial [Planctomycetota bacterium]